MKCSNRWLALASFCLAGGGQAATIDQMIVDDFTFTSYKNDRSHNYWLWRDADQLRLNDGRLVGAGAGYARFNTAEYLSYEVNGDTVSINFQVQPVYYYGHDFLLMLDQHTSSVETGYGESGTLALQSPYLVVEAQRGSSSAVLKGYAKILLNQPDNTYSEFLPYSAAVGDSVYFEQHFELLNGALFNSHLLDGDFTYAGSGFIDFTRIQPVPEPASYALMGAGVAALAIVRRRKQASRSL